jgi:hypothetical protein
MPRVLIRDDNGHVTLDERVQASDFESEHFRRCLAERLWWATEDAEQASTAEVDDSHAARSHTDRNRRTRRRGSHERRALTPQAARR